MIAGEALLDAFLNANVLICVGFAFWIAWHQVMWRVGLRYAYATQLKLLNTMFIVIGCAPLVVLAYGAMKGAGYASQVNLNLSDLIVSHYLNGGFEMKASEFEGLVLMRDTFILNVLIGAGFVAKAAIVVFVVGFCVGLVRLIYSFNCLRRIVGQSYRWRSIGRVRIHVSDRTMVPFSTRGLRHYYVVIPSHMLTQSSELQVAIAHELQHIRQGDLEWEIVLEALKPLFFLNPAYHAWKRQVEALREGVVAPENTSAKAGATETAGGKADTAEDAKSAAAGRGYVVEEDRKSTRLNSSHRCISYAVFCLKKKKKKHKRKTQKISHNTI